MSQSVWAAVTKRSSTGFLISNRNLFLIILESEKSKNKLPAYSVSDEDTFPDFVFSLCPHMVEGLRELSENLSFVSPIPEGSTIMI